MEQEETRIQELIDYLQGTCKSLFEACSDLGFEEDDLTTEEFEELDSQIFNCAQCGWWCEVSEMSSMYDDETFCEDCASSDSENEEE